MNKLYSTLKKHTCKFINKNYLIKVYGRDANGKKINTLMGVFGILKLIGAELLEKFIDRAEKAMTDKVVCKLRRGLTITLYAH